MLHRVTSIPLVFLIGMIGLAATFPAVAQDATTERPMIELTVLVLNQDREPVPDAMVSIAAIPARKRAPAEPLVDSKSALDGLARLTLDPNTRGSRELFVIRVQHPQFDLHYHEHVVYPLDRAQSRTVVLPPLSENRRFQVIDSSGEPAGGARALVQVSRICHKQIHVEEEFISDPDGWISLPMGIRGKFVYVTHARGVHNRPLGEPEIIQLEESISRVFECFDKKTGAPLAGVAIGSGGRRLGETDPNGRLELPRNTITSHQYLAARPSGIEYFASNPIHEEGLKVFRLSPRPLVRGRAQWQDGSPYLPVPCPSGQFGRSILPDGNSWISEGALHSHDSWLWKGFFGGEEAIAKIPLGTAIHDAPLETCSRPAPKVVVHLKDSFGNDLPFQQVARGVWSDGASLVRTEHLFQWFEQWTVQAEGRAYPLEVLLGGQEPVRPVRAVRAGHYAVWIPEGRTVLSLEDLITSIRIKPSSCGICVPTELFIDRDFIVPVPAGEEFVIDSVPPGYPLQLRPSPANSSSMFAADPLELSPLRTGEQRVIHVADACPTGVVTIPIHDVEGRPVSQEPIVFESWNTRKRPQQTDRRELTTDHEGNLVLEHVNRGWFKLHTTDRYVLLGESSFQSWSKYLETIRHRVLRHPEFGHPHWRGLRTPTRRLTRLSHSPTFQTDREISPATLLRRETVRTRFEFPDGRPVAGAHVELLEVGFPRREFTSDAQGSIEIPHLCLDTVVVLEVRDPENQRYFARVGFPTGREIPAVQSLGGEDASDGSPGTEPEVTVIHRGAVVRFQLSRLPATRTPVSIIREGSGEVRHTATWEGDELVARLPIQFFQLPGRDQVEWTLRLLHEDWYSEPFKLQLEPEEQVTLTLDCKAREPRTYNIEVRDADGEPLSGVPVWVRPDYIWTSQTLPTTATDENGRVTIETKTPVAELQSLPIDGMSQPRVMLHDRESGTIEVQLQKNVQLSLHLRGSRILEDEGASFSLNVHEPIDELRPGITPWKVGTLTGETVHFPEITANRYFLSIFLNRREVHRVDLGHLTGVIERTIELPGGCELSGTVTRDGQTVSGGRVQLLVEGSTGPAEYVGEVDASGRFRVLCYFLGESSLKYFPPKPPQQSVPRYRRQVIELTPGEQQFDFKLEPIE